MTADEQRAKWREYTRRWRALNPEKNREVAQRANAKYYATPEGRAAAARGAAQQKAKRVPHPRILLTVEEKAERKVEQNVKNRERRASVPPEDRASARRVRYEARREAEATAARLYRQTHLEEMKVVQSAWRKAHPEAVRASKRRARYGLAQGAYEAMFEAQGGTCAICRKPETQVDKSVRRPVRTRS